MNTDIMMINEDLIDKINVIGIMGKIGSGKSTLSNYLVTEKNFNEFSFADPLKKGLIEFFGMDEKDFYGSQEDKLKVNEYWNTSARELCQTIGTNIFRDSIKNFLPNLKSDDNFWIKRTHLNILKYVEKENAKNMNSSNENNKINIVFSDIRFENELNYVKNQLNGKVYYIERRNNTHGVINHKSESNYQDLITKYNVITLENNSSINNLYNKFINL